jgi:gas vesicle protein
MDWMTQSQDLFKSWMDMQMKTWDSWFKSMQETEKMDPTQMWVKSIEAWQATIKNTLSAQVEGSRIWAESVSSLQGAPDVTGDWAKQVQGMAKNWTELQQQMWDNWFEAIKNADPAELMNQWNVDGSPLMTGWQEMTQKITEAQSEWTKNFMPEQSGAKKK